MNMATRRSGELIRAPSTACWRKYPRNWVERVGGLEGGRARLDLFFKKLGREKRKQVVMEGT